MQLFHRSTRRVALTRAGTVYYDHCVRILGDVDLSAEVVRSVAGKAVRKIRIGTVYPATIGMLPAFLARIGRKYPDIELHISSGSTNDIIRGLENGQINLGFIRPVENIGSLSFFSIAHERYLLAVEKKSALLAQSEIGIEDLKGEKIISFSRQNLSYTERYIAPEWTLDLPNRNFELRKVRGVDFRIGLGVAWSKDDPTAARDDIIDIARSLVRAGSEGRAVAIPRSSGAACRRWSVPAPAFRRRYGSSGGDPLNRLSRARTGSATCLCYL